MRILGEVVVLGALLVAACGETTRKPGATDGAGGEGASGGAFTLPVGSAAGVGQAGRDVAGSESVGGAEGGTEAGGGGDAPGGAPMGEGGEPWGGAAGAGGEAIGGAGGAGGEPSIDDCSDPLVFADPSLEAAVRAALSKPPGPVSRASVQSLGGLTVYDDVTSLGGVECLPSLGALSIRSPGISDLEPLRRLRSLTRLWLYGVPVSDLSTLAELPLTRLVIEQSYVSDLAPLAGLETLEHLEVANSPIQSVAPLASMSQLRGLRVSGCLVDDIGPLADLTNLDFLDVSSNSVSDLKAVSGMTKLISLAISNNDVQDLSPLKSLAELDYLYMAGNRVTDLSPLAELSELDTLYAEQNLITSLAPLAVQFRGFARLDSNRIADFAPLLSFAQPFQTGVSLQYQRDENGQPLVDCAAQAATIALAKNWFAQLNTDCP